MLTAPVFLSVWASGLDSSLASVGGSRFLEPARRRLWWRRFSRRWRPPLIEFLRLLESHMYGEIIMLEAKKRFGNNLRFQVFGLRLAAASILSTFIVSSQLTLAQQPNQQVFHS